MPLVRIDLRKGKTTGYRAAIGQGIHAAMVAIIEVPIDDRFQVISEHEPDGLTYDAAFMGVDRSDDIVIIQITMRRGRTPEMRQALYRAIIANLEQNPGVRPEDVMITLVENDPVDWSFGKGEAHLLRFLPAQMPTGPAQPPAAKTETR